MSVLHTISKSSALSQASTKVAAVAKTDAVILLEDAVYLACRTKQLDHFPTSSKLFALRADIQARGLAERLDQRVELVDYEGFVDLCCDYDKIVSWF